MTRLLLIDSDVRLATALSAALRRTGYQVQHVHTAINPTMDHHWDLVLMDPGLSGADGLTLCRQLRRVGDMGIVVLAAGGSEHDRVAALRSGADDYIVKPFSFAELQARLEAVLRRVRPATQGILNVGSLRVDLGRHQTFVDTTPVELTRKEFQVLAVLAEQPGAVVSRDRLIAEVWPRAKANGSRTLDVHVATLRAKLGETVRVEAVRGVGYRIVAPAEPDAAATSAMWRTVVLSPHFDDAVLSAAGLIMRDDGQAAIVTVFGGVPAEDVPASEWDSLSGFRTAAEAARVRAHEDVQACQLLNADSVHLPYLDGPYANTDNLDDLTDLLAALPPQTRVLVPAGVGGNPDHVRVRDAALAALAKLPDRQVGLYADLPYAAALWHWGNHTPDSPLAGQAGLRVLAGLSTWPPPGHADTDVVMEHIRLDDAQWQRKRGAVYAYPSQLGPLGSHAFRFLANPGPLQHEVVWWLGASDADH